ncbi:MAG: radical SAM family heme chaperone HemW [Actinomycetia bacterium]|nr:radical SAM family heme chaperone HemW [Actinomycetes bacterium]
MGELANPQGASADSPKFVPFQELYLHIPFCAQRCSYCDFTTEATVAEDAALDTYVDELVSIIGYCAGQGALKDVRTIYIGGGTPSFLGARRLSRLVGALTKAMGSLDGVVEFTVEANPESIDKRMVEELAALGVNRFSLGVQSFDDHELQALGRIHDSASAQAALSVIRSSTENVAIDLMCGIPLQSAVSWQASLDAAVSCGANHISVYPLSLEKGCALTDAVASGRVVVADQDTQADLLLQAEQYLQKQGFDHYEIASYARPGFQCQHNIGYWTGQPYLGIGRGAVTMCIAHDGRRIRILDGKWIDVLSAHEAWIEEAMLRMRLASGLADSFIFQNHKGMQKATVAIALQKLLEEMVELGLLKHTQGRYSIADHSWLLGNEVFGRIWSLADHDMFRQ